jgi:hypothetical protein
LEIRTIMIQVTKVKQRTVNRISKSKIHLFGLLVICMISITPVMGVIAQEKDEKIRPLRDLSISDLGAHIFFNFSNVTFTTDGSGIDLVKSKISSSSEIQEIQAIQVLEDIRFGVTDSETYTKYKQIYLGADSSVIESLQFKALNGQETNQTTKDFFEFPDQRKASFSVDVRTGLGQKTKFAHDVSAQAASAVSSDIIPSYAFLNETLVKQSEQFGLEDGYFDGRANRVDRGKYETIALGYRNFEQGALTDLKNFIAFVTGNQVSNIKIIEYEFADAQLTFNMSTKLKTWIKDLVDFSIRKTPGLAGKLASDPNFDLTMKLNSIEGMVFFGDILGGINAGINTLTCTVGSAVDHFFDDPVDATIGTVYRGMKDVSDTVMSFVGPAVMDSVRSGKDLLTGVTGGLTEAVGTGAGNLLEAPFGVFGGFLTDLAGGLLPVIIIIVIVGILTILIYFTVKKYIARKATQI